MSPELCPNCARLVEMHNTAPHVCDQSWRGYDRERAVPAGEDRLRAALVTLKSKLDRRTVWSRDGRQYVPIYLDEARALIDDALAASAPEAAERPPKNAQTNQNFGDGAAERPPAPSLDVRRAVENLVIGVRRVVAARYGLTLTEDDFREALETAAALAATEDPSR